MSKNGREVFEYPSSLMNQLEQLGIHHLDSYGYDSYEAYYAELDKKKLEVESNTINR